MAYDSTIDGKTVDRSYSAVANLLNKVPFVRSFKIIKANTNKHSLTINQNRFIGTYPTRDAALGSLMGCVKLGGGAEDFAIKSIEDMIAKGRGIFAGFAQQAFTINIENGVIQNSSFANVSGEDIFSMNSWGKLWNLNLNQIRLWYGSYTGNAAAGLRANGTQVYEFANGTLAGEYRRRFTVKLSINGGSEVTLNASAGTTQTEYENNSTTLSSDIWTGSGSVAYAVNITVTED
jgi:hypothetical protein